MDRRAVERAKETGLAAEQRRSRGSLVQGQTTNGPKQALARLAAAYPDRINPYL